MSGRSHTKIAMEAHAAESATRAAIPRGLSRALLVPHRLYMEDPKRERAAVTAASERRLLVTASSHTLRCRTRGNGHILDLTSDVQAAIAESGIATGHAAVMVVGSTAALTTLEYEPGLVDHDLVAALERVAPESGRYVHEETWHDDNGHSHVRAALIGPSLALPIVEGRVPLGTWQQLVLVDLDTRPRDRSIILTVTGEPGAS